MTESSTAFARALDSRHVAIFGASGTPGMFGHNTAKVLLDGGYPGKVTLVNPGGRTAFGGRS